MIKIRSKNLEAALAFLYVNKGKEYLPDEIKEQACIFTLADRVPLIVKCSHASTGRMLRRAEQKGTAYHGLILRRGSVRNATDTDDLATFYLDFPTDEEIKNGRA